MHSESPPPDARVPSQGRWVLRHSPQHRFANNRQPLRVSHLPTVACPLYKPTAPARMSRNGRQ